MYTLKMGSGENNFVLFHLISIGLEIDVCDEQKLKMSLAFTIRRAENIPGGGMGGAPVFSLIFRRPNVLSSRDETRSWAFATVPTKKPVPRARKSTERPTSRSECVPGLTWFRESDDFFGAPVKIVRLGIGGGGGGVLGRGQPRAGRRRVAAAGDRGGVRVGGRQPGQRFDGQRLHQEPRGPRLGDVRLGRHAQLGQYLLFDRLDPLLVQARPGRAVVVPPAAARLVLPPVMVPVGAGRRRRRRRGRRRRVRVGRPPRAPRAVLPLPSVT